MYEGIHHKKKKKTLNKTAFLLFLFLVWYLCFAIHKLIPHQLFFNINLLDQRRRRSHVRALSPVSIIRHLVYYCTEKPFTLLWGLNSIWYDRWISFSGDPPTQLELLLAKTWCMPFNNLQSAKEGPVSLVCLELVIRKGLKIKFCRISTFMKKQLA